MNETLFYGVGVGILLLLVIAFVIAIRRERTVDAYVITGQDVSEDDEAPEAPKTTPSIYRRGAYWVSSRVSLAGIVILGLAIAVTYFVTRDMNWSDAPIDKPDITTVSTDPSSKYQEIVHVVAHHDKWVALRDYMPDWFANPKSGGRDKFSTGEYFVWMKIGEDGEPFKYGPKMKRELSGDQFKSAWIMSIPNGDRRKGYAYFKLLR